MCCNDTTLNAIQHWQLLITTKLDVSVPWHSVQSLARTPVKSNLSQQTPSPISSTDQVVSEMLIHHHIHKTAGTSIHQTIQLFISEANRQRGPEAISRNLKFVHGHRNCTDILKVDDHDYITFLRNPAERNISHIGQHRRAGDDNISHMLSFFSNHYPIEIVKKQASFFEYVTSPDFSIEGMKNDFYDFYRFILYNRQVASFSLPWDPSTKKLFPACHATQIKFYDDFEKNPEKYLEIALNKLKKFTFVGIQEKFDQHSQLLFNHLGLAEQYEQTFQNVNPKKVNYEHSSELIELDTEVYNFFVNQDPVRSSLKNRLEPDFPVAASDNIIRASSCPCSHGWYPAHSTERNGDIVPLRWSGPADTQSFNVNLEGKSYHSITVEITGTKYQAYPEVHLQTPNGLIPFARRGLVYSLNYKCSGLISILFKYAYPDGVKKTGNADKDRLVGFELETIRFNRRPVNLAAEQEVQYSSIDVFKSSSMKLMQRVLSLFKRN